MLTPAGTGTSKITWPVSPRRAARCCAPPDEIELLLTITAGTSRESIRPSPLVSISGETVGAAKTGLVAFHCDLAIGSQSPVGWYRLSSPVAIVLLVSSVSG